MLSIRCAERTLCPTHAAPEVSCTEDARGAERSRPPATPHGPQRFVPDVPRPTRHRAVQVGDNAVRTPVWAVPAAETVAGDPHRAEHLAPAAAGAAVDDVATAGHQVVRDRQRRLIAEVDAREHDRRLALRVEHRVVVDLQGTTATSVVDVLVVFPFDRAVGFDQRVGHIPRTREALRAVVRADALDPRRGTAVQNAVLRHIHPGWSTPVTCHVLDHRAADPGLDPDPLPPTGGTAHLRSVDGHFGILDRRIARFNVDRPRQPDPRDRRPRGGHGHIARLQGQRRVDRHAGVGRIRIAARARHTHAVGLGSGRHRHRCGSGAFGDHGSPGGFRPGAPTARENDHRGERYGPRTPQQPAVSLLSSHTLPAHVCPESGGQ